MGILLAMLFFIGGLWMVAAVLFGAVGIVFKLGFWALQLVGAVLGFVFFGGGILALLGILLVCNLIGLPFLLLRRH